MKGISGRVALVTGASRGIGREVALRLADAGARLALVARSADALDEVAAEVSKRGAEVETFPCDLADHETIAQTVKAVEKRLAGVELLVNNAGITADGLMLRMKLEAWERVLSINLTGTFVLTQAVLRSMIRARFGRIISISSVVGLMGNAGQANYAASKAGLVGFSKSLAREVGSRGITVNVVAPGFIETDMTAELEEGPRARMLDGLPLGRAGTATEIAEVVAFLLSEGASYMTGVVVPVDGGMSM